MSNRWDDMGCYIEREPLHVPRKDDEHDWSELDGQEYQPSPHIEPDNRTGFDQDGNYHVTVEAPRPQINMSYRIASEINQFVIRQVEMCDYDVGRIERDEIAHAYLLHLIDQNAFTDDMMAFEALQIWRTQYGGDLRG